MKNSKKTSPKNKKEKIVYLPMAVDLIHIGHITIINEAKNTKSANHADTASSGFF